MQDSKKSAASYLAGRTFPGSQVATTHGNPLALLRLSPPRPNFPPLELLLPGRSLTLGLLLAFLSEKYDVFLHRIVENQAHILRCLQIEENHTTENKNNPTQAQTPIILVFNVNVFPYSSESYFCSVLRSLKTRRA